jgi:hypothetical protein
VHGLEGKRRNDFISGLEAEFIKRSLADQGNETIFAALQARGIDEPPDSI